MNIYSGNHGLQLRLVKDFLNAKDFSTQRQIRFDCVCPKLASVLHSSLH